MKSILWIACIALGLLCETAQAAQVTLAWDANNPTPTGYQLFHRLAGAEYDYGRPVWQGSQTTCTVTVPDGAESFFVVRAYVTSGSRTEVSADSNEAATLTKPEAPKNLLIQAIDQLIVGLQTMRQWAVSQPQ